MDNDKVTVYKPLNNHPMVPWRHAGDTFRETIDMWENDGFIDVIETSDNPGVVWMYEENDVLLYDRPTLQWYPKDMKYNIGLFGNPVPPVSSETNVPWIFWGRHPRLLNEKYNTQNKSYAERTNESIFVGNIENNVQQHYRSKYGNNEWKKAISKFELTIGKKHLYSPSEYLDMLGSSKFGLSIRGYGPKCNREVELLGMGCVPLLTPDVDVQYYDPLIEGMHYYRVKSPEEAKSVMSQCNQPKWEFMSRAGRRWFKRNATSMGSFRTTKRIVERSRGTESTKLNAISTMATNMTYNDLQLMLYSLYQFHPDITVFIVCDSKVVSNLKEWGPVNIPSMHLELIPSLNEYTGMNRKEMEKNGKFMELVLHKCDGIDAAFEKGFSNVLFVDSDMVFLNEFDLESWGDNRKNDIGRSPHHNKLINQQQFGVYNAGMVWVNHQGFTDWWKFGSYTKSRYYEQAILEDTQDNFSSFDIPIQYNYGWWRLYECEAHLIPERESFFRVVNGVIMYDNKPLRTIHTHFGEKRFLFTVRFNQFMMKLLVACKDERLTRIYNFVRDLFYVEKQIKDSPQQDIIEMSESHKSSLAPPPVSTQSQENDITVPVAKADKMSQVGGISKEVAKQNSSEESEHAQIHLISQYYNDSNTDRQDEIDYCFQANLSNPHIAKLHNLVEENVLVPDWLKNDPKYVEHRVSGWLTYKQTFDYANENISPDSMVCLSNADIFLDHSSRWNDAKKLLDLSIVFCLSRYEFDGISSAKRDAALMKLAYANAQDAWLFKTPMNVKDADFKYGKLGSDNAIADRIKNSGYIPVNSPNQFKLYHYDLCRGKTGENFLQHQKPNPEKPEDRGYYLLPDIDAVRSVDNLIDTLGLGSVHKYRVICDVMSKYVDIKNPDIENKK